MAGEYTFQGPVNFGGNELRNFALQVLAAAPANPALGQEYFDSALGHARVCTDTTPVTWEQASGFVTGGGGGAGTVTTISVAAANGFAGTVANPTTTPAITITTTVSGLLKGNGTAISAAVSGTDYLAPNGSGAGLTNLNATNIATGTLNQARGGTGTDLSATGGAKQVVRQLGVGADLTVGTLDHTYISDFDAQVRTSRLDQMAVPLAAVPMNGQRITGLADPAAATDAATKNYVDAGIQGFTTKPTADVATTAALPANTYANGTAGVGATITLNVTGVVAVDGRNLLLNDLVLVKDEATRGHNGLYAVTTAPAVAVAGVLTRVPEMDEAGEFVGGMVPVGPAGPTNANSLWLCGVTTTPTVGTTPIPFTQLNKGTDLRAANGIAIVGNTVSVVVAPRLVFNAGAIDLAPGVAIAGTATKVSFDTYGRVTGGSALGLGDLPVGTARGFAADVGDGVTATIVVTHNLGTRDITVGFRDNLSPYGVMQVYWEANTLNTIRIYFSDLNIPTANRWRVVIHSNL